MKLNVVIMFCTVASFAQSVAYSQEATPSTEANPVLEERLRNAQVTERRLPNGAVFTVSALLTPPLTMAEAMK